MGVVGAQDERIDLPFMSQGNVPAEQGSRFTVYLGAGVQDPDVLVSWLTVLPHALVFGEIGVVYSETELRGDPEESMGGHAAHSELE